MKLLPCRMHAVNVITAQLNELQCTDEKSAVKQLVVDVGQLRSELSQLSCAINSEASRPASYSDFAATSIAPYSDVATTSTATCTVSQLLKPQVCNNVLA